MSININKAQADFLREGGDFGGENIAEFGVVNGVIQQYGGLLLENIDKYGNLKKVSASGDLLSNLIPEILEDNGIQIFRLRMLDYYDYVNEGVKGVNSSRNAPNSPYQYKNYGMPESGRASLKKYILSGRAKIASVTNDKALGIGGESKGVSFASKKSLIDKQVDTLAYLIKRFGIKATNYFTDAVNETFKDFEVKMVEAVERDVIITFKSINLKDNGNN
jgi:hypothetical protein